VTVWWVVLLVGGTVFMADTFGITRAYRNERVPSRGFQRSVKTHRRPWWTWVTIPAGTALMVFGSIRLGGSPPDVPLPDLKYFLPTMAAAWIADTLVIRAHNSRVGVDRP
jgi:hypothetical protein